MAFVWAAVAASSPFPTPSLPLLPIASYIPTVPEMRSQIRQDLSSPARLSASAPHLPTLHSQWLVPPVLLRTLSMPHPPLRLQPLREVLQLKHRALSMTSPLILSVLVLLLPLHNCN